MSDVTLRVNMTPLTVEYRLLIKNRKLKRAGVLKNDCFEFPPKQRKWHMLFDLLRIFESTCFAIRQNGSDQRRSE